MRPVSSHGLVLLLVGCLGFSELSSPGSAEALAAARIAGSFLERVLKAFPYGPESFMQRHHFDFDYGVVYAAVGPTTLKKASVSATSVRNVLGSDVGTMLVTSEFGFASLAPQAKLYGEAFWWDYVASVSGLGINFSALPEFEAFTVAHKRPSSATGLSSTFASNRKIERERKETKPLAWAAVRQLRSAKMAALLLAQEVFKVATIFLDADTLVCDSLYSVFEAVAPLGPWFAFVPAPSEHHSTILQRMYGIQKGDKPPEPNTGVVAISTCDGARRVLKRWNEIYWHESLALGPIQNPMDQPPFRAALYLEDASWIPLDRKFNCRGHVRNVNAALPMRCGGFSSAHWEALARSAILEAVGTVQPRGGASISSAKTIQGGSGCAILHSHSVPRRVQTRSGYQRNALVLLDDDSKQHKLFGFGLERISASPSQRAEPIGTARHEASHISIPKAHPTVAIFHLPFSPRPLRVPSLVQDAADWRSGNWRNQTILSGPMAKDACSAVLIPCAIVLVLVDPLVQLAADESLDESKSFFQDFNSHFQNYKSHVELLRTRAKKSLRKGATLLDALLPLDTSDLAFVDDPRAIRIVRYGAGNAADVADTVARLQSDAFLVLLTANPDDSRRLLDMAFRKRPEVQKALGVAFGLVRVHDSLGHQSLRVFNESTKASLRRQIDRDMVIYNAAARLFGAQCDASSAKSKGRGGANTFKFSPQSDP